MFNKIKYGKINKIRDDGGAYYEFNTKQEASTWGNDYYGEWALSYKEKVEEKQWIDEIEVYDDPIRCYAGYTAREINEYLRTGHKEFTPSCDLKKMINSLMKALYEAPRIPSDIVVYRLVPKIFVKELLENNKKSKPIQEKAFMSTSLLTNIVKDENEYSSYKDMLKIYVNAGSIGVYIDGIENRGENEILFAPGMFLELVKYPYRDKTTKIMVYECRIINPK